MSKNIKNYEEKYIEEYIHIKKTTLKKTIFWFFIMLLLMFDIMMSVLLIYGQSINTRFAGFAMVINCLIVLFYAINKIEKWN